MVFGVGRYDLPENLIKGSENYIVYSRWCNMLRRVYDEKYLKVRPTYLKCSVTDEWLWFSKFSRDVRNMKCFDKILESSGWCLDKDIIGDGTLYSKDTCCIVPQEVNNFLLDNRSSMGKYPTGVKFNKSKGKFEANVNRWGTRKYLGTFTDVSEALLIYQKAKREYAIELSRKWENILDERVLNFLINFNPAYKVNAVEIDDEHMIFKI